MLGGILDNSQVRVIILNGQTVVDTLKEISNVNFELAYTKKWEIPSTNGRLIPWHSYGGTVSNIGGTDLEREVKVLGFSRNIQRYVPTRMRISIRNWITKSFKEMFPRDQETCNPQSARDAV